MERASSKQLKDVVVEFVYEFGWWVELSTIVVLRVNRNVVESK